MPRSQPLSPDHLSALAAELEAVVRRHDPAWTGSSAGDPGITLLELLSYLGDSLAAVSPAFPTNPSRSDPYKNFKFRVTWDGAQIPGISRVSGLGRVVQATEYREGAEPNIVHRAPGATTYEPITLERGVTHDTSFEDWAKLVIAASPAAGAHVGHLKTVRIEILSQAGQPVLAYDVYHCWPTAYRPLPELLDGAPMRLVETITLVHDGWERDPAVVFPR